MSLPSMPLLYSMLGKPFTVMLTFVWSGLKYFSESLVLTDLTDVIPHRVLQYGSRVFHNQLVDQSACDVLHEEVVGVPSSQVEVKLQCKQAGQRTSCSFSLGTKVYSVSLGLALLRSKVIRLTAHSAFTALRFFSV